MKQDHRPGRNFLARAAGGAINPVLAAADYIFRRTLVAEAFAGRILYSLCPGRMAHPA